MGTAKNRPMLGISLGLLVTCVLFFFAHTAFTLIFHQSRVDLTFYLGTIPFSAASFLLTLFYALVGYKLGFRLNAPRLGLAFALVCMVVCSVLWSILWGMMFSAVADTLLAKGFFSNFFIMILLTHVMEYALLLLPPVLAVGGLVGYNIGAKKQQAEFGCMCGIFLCFAVLFLLYFVLLGIPAFFIFFR